MEQKIKTPTIKQIENFCKDHYYCDSGILWQPFEDYEEEQVKNYIENDIQALCQFLGIKNK